MSHVPNKKAEIMMQVEKKKSFIIRSLYFTIICVIIFLLSKYVIPILAPFIAGLVIAIIARNTVTWILKKYRVNRTLLSIGTLIVMYAAVIFLVTVIGGRIFVLLKDFFIILPERYTRDIQPAIDTMGENITKRFPYLRDIISVSASGINDSIIKFMERASSTFVNSITNIAGTVTGLLVKMMFTIISSVIFTLDLPTIEGWVKKQMDDRTLYVYNNVLFNAGNTIFKFLKAYAVIISVTFAELALGLSILGVRNSILLALVIGLLDALPVIGTGTVMVPWIIYQMITGKTSLAIGLLILYVIIFVVRQFLEPTVVGDSIGLHPIVILICLFVGVRLFGLIGLFLFPIAITILKKLNDDKVISIFK